MNLVEFLPEIVEQIEAQLIQDQGRWGDTWKHRSRDGQEARAYARFQDYWDQYENADVPIPWLKIIGEAIIAVVREQHPEELDSAS